MFEKLFDSFLNYLSNHPDIVNANIKWSACTFFEWFVLAWYRKEIIDGLKGHNLLFEHGEIICGLALICFPPTLFHILFFETKGYQIYALYAEIGIFAVTLYGRYIFDWALAFKSGSDRVTQTPMEPTKITTETKTETKITP